MVTEALSEERIARLRIEGEEPGHISDAVFQAEARADVQRQDWLGLFSCWEEASEAGGPQEENDKR